MPDDQQSTDIQPAENQSPVPAPDPKGLRHAHLVQTVTMASGILAMHRQLGVGFKPETLRQAESIVDMCLPAIRKSAAEIVASE